VKAQASILGSLILITVLVTSVGLILYAQTLQSQELSRALSKISQVNPPIIEIPGPSVYSSRQITITYVYYPNGSWEKIRLNVSPSPINVSHLFAGFSWIVLVDSQGRWYNLSYIPLDSALDLDRGLNFTSGVPQGVIVGADPPPPQVPLTWYLQGYAYNYSAALYGIGDLNPILKDYFQYVSRSGPTSFQFTQVTVFNTYWNPGLGLTGVDIGVAGSGNSIEMIMNLTNTSQVDPVPVSAFVRDLDRGGNLSDSILYIEFYAVPFGEVAYPLYPMRGYWVQMPNSNDVTLQFAVLPFTYAQTSFNMYGRGGWVPFFAWNYPMGKYNEFKVIVFHNASGEYVSAYLKVNNSWIAGVAYGMNGVWYPLGARVGYAFPFGPMKVPDFLPSSYDASTRDYVFVTNNGISIMGDIVVQVGQGDFLEYLYVYNS